MEEDDKLARELAALQKQLQGMESDEEDNHPTSKLDAELKALQSQLGMDSDEETKKPAKKPSVQQPQSQARSEYNNNKPVQVLPTEQPRTQNVPQRAIQEPSVHQRMGPPEVVDLNSLFCMEQSLNEFSSDIEYCAKVLNKKEKYLGLVRQGKITGEFYKNSLKDPRTIKHPKLAKYVETELELLKKFPSAQECLNKIVSKCEESIPKQRNLVGQAYIPVVVSNPPAQGAKQGSQQRSNPQTGQKPASTFAPLPENKMAEIEKKLLTPSNTASKMDREFIQKLDEAKNDKKVEILLKSLSKVESLLAYYKQHMPQEKTVEIRESLVPKKQVGLKIVQALIDGKKFPVGDFIVNKLSKLDFEQFHNLDRKEYSSRLDTLNKQVKNYEKIERDFKKRCTRNEKDNFMSLQHSNSVLSSYQEYTKNLSAAKTKSFQPLPTVSIVVEERENYYENLKLQRNDLQIIVSRIDGIESALLKIYFDTAPNSRTSMEVVAGDQKVDHIIKMTDQQIRDIEKKTVRLKLETKRLFMFSSDLAIAEISLKDFMNQNSIQGVFDRNGVKITYQINIRLPKNKISKSIIETLYMTFKPEYVHTPEFQVDFIKKYINYSSVPADGSQPAVQKPAASTAQVQPQKPAAGLLFYAVRSDSMISQIKQMNTNNVVTVQQLLKPELYCDSLTYLSKMETVIQKALNEQYEAKVNKKILEELEDEVMKKKMVVESSRKSGKLTPQIYVGSLQNSIKMDTFMMDLYTKYSLSEFARFLSARIALVQSQLAALGQPVSGQPQQQPAQKQLQQANQPPVSNQTGAQGIDISKYPLKFAKRTPQVKQKLASVTGPIENIDPDKIKNPEKYSHSLKYLAEMQDVLDKALNDCVGDKQTRSFVEDLSDEIMKFKMIITKKKSTISPEQYKTLLRADIEADRRILNVYRKLGVPELQEFILARIRVIKQEIGEPLVLQLLREATFDTSKTLPLFELPRTQASEAALSKYGAAYVRPDLPRYCSCMSYIEAMLQIAKEPGLAAELSKMKEHFQQAGANGTLDPQSYADTLKQQRQEDLKRMEVYKSLDLEMYYHFIKTRMQIVDEQLASF